MSRGGRARGTGRRDPAGVYYPPPPAPPLELRQAPGVAVVTQFQAGHGWTLLGGTTGDLNATGASQAIGTQCAWFRGNGDNSVVGMRRTGGPSFDLTGKDLGILLRVDNPDQLLPGGGVAFILYLGNSAFANFITFDLTNAGAIKYFPKRNTYLSADGGSWVYLGISIDTTTNSYTAKTGAQTFAQIIANVTDWQLYKRDLNPSTPSRVAVNEIFTVPKQATYPNGVCCLTFDDGYASCITKAAPMIQAASGRATAYIIKDQIQAANYLTLAQARQLQDTYAWTVGCHSFTGVDHEAGGDGFPSLTPEQSFSDIQLERAWLQSNGFANYDHLAYPHGAYCLEEADLTALNDRVDVTLAPILKTARSLYNKMPETIPCADRMKLRSWISTSSVTSLATLQTAADVTKRCKGAMVVVFHEIVDGPITQTSQWLTADLQSFVTYLGAQGIPLRTIGEVFP